MGCVTLSRFVICTEPLVPLRMPVAQSDGASTLVSFLKKGQSMPPHIVLWPNGQVGLFRQGEPEPSEVCGTVQPVTPGDWVLLSIWHTVTPKPQFMIYKNGELWTELEDPELDTIDGPYSIDPWNGLALFGADQHLDTICGGQISWLQVDSAPPAPTDIPFVTGRGPNSVSHEPPTICHSVISAAVAPATQ